MDFTVAVLFNFISMAMANSCGKVSFNMSNNKGLILSGAAIADTDTSNQNYSIFRNNPIQKRVFFSPQLKLINLELYICLKKLMSVGNFR
jgi:hypothetical protein